MTEGTYRRLIVWQKAMQLVEEIYDLTRLIPREEMYGLVDQMRRAAVSVPSNIAEGKYRLSHKDGRNYFRMAYGSCAELETQLTIAERLYKLPGGKCSYVRDLIEDFKDA